MLCGCVRALQRWFVGAWHALVRAVRVFFIGEHASDTDPARQIRQQEEAAARLPCSKTTATRALFMAYAAYFACEWLGSTDYIQAQTRASLTETLEDPELQRLLADEDGDEDGSFDLVWGPACYQAVMSAVADNTVFVCEKRQNASAAKRRARTLYVSIAGTHPLSAFNWFLDLSVVRAVPWPYAQRADCFFSVVQPPAASPPASPRRTAGEDQSDLRLSSGTLLGLKTLLALRDPATGQSLVEYLRDRTAACKERGERLSVVVVGHSLGGALAGAMALYLHDNVAVWDPTISAALGCVTFAAPTFANAQLARYYDRCLGAHTARLANSCDLVPTAWDADELTRAYTLYEPDVSTPLVLSVAIQGVLGTVKDKNYRHVCEDQRPFTLRPEQPDKDFVRQVMIQHNQSYFLHLGQRKMTPFIARHVPLMRELICDGTFTVQTLLCLADMVKNKLVSSTAQNVSWFKMGNVVPKLKEGFWTASDTVVALARSCAEDIQGVFQSATKDLTAMIGATEKQETAAS